MASSCATCRVVLLLVALADAALADVRLPSVISNHMVLQAGSPVSVWGWADPAEEVSVTFAGQVVKTVTSAGGKWEVKLSSLQKSATASRLTVQGRNTLNVEDVLVGEVWLGSGQSNMQLPISRAKDFQKEKADARFPEIRLFTVGNRASEQAQQVFAALRRGWCPCLLPIPFSLVAIFAGNGIEGIAPINPRTQLVPLFFT